MTSAANASSPPSYRDGGVDVRDLADVHIRAMTAPEAAGQRILATGEFLWMRDTALALRAGLGDAAGKVPTRNLPNLAIRAFAIFDPSLREIMPALGRRHRHTTDKAQRLLDRRARPAATPSSRAPEA